MLRPRTARADRGFTLLESLVVLFILALMLAIGMPWWQKISRRNQMRSAASEIQTTLLAVRMKAVRRNSPASVLITTALPTESQHRLETIEPDPPAPTPTPLPSQTLDLSTNTIAFVALPAGNKITFDGNGLRLAPPSSLPADIVIQGPPGGSAVNQVTIRTSVSGKIEVVTPTVWQ